MSEVFSPWGRRLLNSFRSGRAIQIAIGALIALVILVVIALLYGDLPEFLNPLGRELRQVMRHQQYLPGYGALYLEESGVPLPAPGDVFVMFVGAHVPRHWAAWIGAWLGLILVVVLGATNLFFISRRYGRRLATSSLAEYIHLNHERMERAELWFKRYGVLAIIFGRHIPGFRVPITVAAGTLGVSYRVFAPSVAVSTAIWAGVMLTVGMTIGPRLALLLHAHGWIYVIWGAIVVVLVGATYGGQRRRAARVGASRDEAKRPVESPSS